MLLEPYRLHLTTHPCCTDIHSPWWENMRDSHLTSNKIIRVQAVQCLAQSLCSLNTISLQTPLRPFSKHDLSFGMSQPLALLNAKAIPEHHLHLLQAQTSGLGETSQHE